MHNAADKAPDKLVVFVQVVLHALCHLTHPQIVVGQACTARMGISRQLNMSSQSMSAVLHLPSVCMHLS